MPLDLKQEYIAEKVIEICAPTVFNVIRNYPKHLHKDLICFCLSTISTLVAEDKLELK